MEKIFLYVLNMSLTASFIIIAILFARLPLKKAPKIISYALWAVAGFRFVFPFTLESVLSLLPFKAAPIPQDIAMQAVPRIDSGIIIIDNAVSALLPAANPDASVNPLQVLIFVGSCIWMFGVVLMLIYSFVSIIFLNHRLSGATLIEGNLYKADNLKTPFVIGLFRPKIYIPAGLTDEECDYVVLHERTHIRRGDHIVKMFAYFILCLHWFNPFAWAAFILMGADMEMSCDERVMRRLGGDIKNAYSLSLVRVAAGRKILNGSPLAFGEGGMKERIKNVLNFKKSSRVIIIVAVTLAAMLSIGFAFNRVDKSQGTNIGLGTFVLENATKQQSLERMTTFTLYNDGTASFAMALISSYIPPKCTFAFENDELVFRAVIKNDFDRGFFGLEDNSIVARFSAIDKYTLVYLSAEIPLFAEPDGKYVLNAAYEPESNISEISPDNAIEMILKSIDVRDGVLSFTLPEGVLADKWSIIIAGRTEVNGFGRSVHLLDGEKWTSGKQYEIKIEDESYTDLLMDISLPEATPQTVDLLEIYRSYTRSTEELTSTQLLPEFNESEAAAARAVVESYFKALSEKDVQSYAALWQRELVNFGFHDDVTITLKDIRYDSQDNVRGIYHGTTVDNIIVFRCDFNVQYNDINFTGAWNEGDYTNWNVILVREDTDKPWLIADHGY